MDRRSSQCAFDIQLKPQAVPAGSWRISISATSSSAEMIRGNRSAATWHTTASGHDSGIHQHGACELPDRPVPAAAEKRPDWPLIRQWGPHVASSPAARARFRASLNGTLPDHLHQQVAHVDIRRLRAPSIRERHRRARGARSFAPTQPEYPGLRHPPSPYASTNARKRRPRAPNSSAEGSPNERSASGSRSNQFAENVVLPERKPSRDGTHRGPHDLVSMHLGEQQPGQRAPGHALVAEPSQPARGEVLLNRAMMEANAPIGGRVEERASQQRLALRFSQSGEYRVSVQHPFTRSGGRPHVPASGWREPDQVPSQARAPRPRCGRPCR